MYNNTKFSTFSFVPGSSNEFALINDSVKLQELLNDFTGDAQPHADNYLNIEN